MIGVYEGKDDLYGSTSSQTQFVYSTSKTLIQVNRTIFKILFEESDNVRFLKISEPTTNTTRLVGYVYEFPEEYKSHLEK